MSFAEFLQRWRDETLSDDPSWRAYDIENTAKLRHAMSALKRLKLTYAGEHAMSEFKARYGVGDAEPAISLLGWWWLWSVINSGRAVRVPLRAGGYHPYRPRANTRQRG